MSKPSQIKIVFMIKFVNFLRMAKFVAYFGKNSNGPEKQIGDSFLTGLLTQPFGEMQLKQVTLAKENLKQNLHSFI